MHGMVGGVHASVWGCIRSPRCHTFPFIEWGGKGKHNACSSLIQPCETCVCHVECVGHSCGAAVLLADAMTAPRCEALLSLLVFSCWVTEVLPLSWHMSVLYPQDNRTHSLWVLQQGPAAACICCSCCNWLAVGMHARTFLHAFGA
jgi:hypothetical protein